MAKLKDAIKGYSPYYVEFVFPQQATHCNLVINTWEGLESGANEWDNNISLEIRKTDLNKDRPVVVDIAPYLREKLQPRIRWGKVVNREPDLIQQGSFVFATYSFQFCDNVAQVCLSEGGYTSPTLLVCAGYTYASHRLFDKNNSMTDDAPYLFDGTLNEAFSLNNVDSAKYRTAIVGSPFNFLYDRNDTQEIHNTESVGILYTRYPDSEFKNTSCSDWVLIYLDKNGLADWLPVTGKVNRSLALDKNTYIGTDGLYNGDVNGYTKFVANLGAVSSVMSNKLAELLLSRAVYLYNTKTEEYNRVIVEESEYLLKDFSFKNKNNYTLKLKASLKTI